MLTAAGVLGVLQEKLRDFGAYRLIVYALMLIIMMLLRPQGLFGTWEVWNLWSKKSQRDSGAA